MPSLVLLDKMCDQASDAVPVACYEARVQDNIVHVADEFTVAWNMLEWRRCSLESCRRLPPRPWTRTYLPSGRSPYLTSS